MRILYLFAKRWLDIGGAFILLILSLPLFGVVGATIKLTSPGPVFHIAPRIGKNGKIFLMPKFRTMRQDTPLLPPYILKNPEKYYTKFGIGLRRYYLDELPQLFSILIGDMSFVGPRPGLARDEKELDTKRKHSNIYSIKPGLTGWAQIHGDGNVPITTKNFWDKYYLDNQSFCLDLKIVLKTINKVLKNTPIVN